MDSLHRVAAALRFLVVVLVASGVTGWMSIRPIGQAEQPPGTWIAYTIERLGKTGPNLQMRFSAKQLAILEKLNRADVTHLPRLDQLVFPSLWEDDDLRYSPFPLQYRAAIHFPKLLLVDQPAQAFAAYEVGNIVRWGPVSSGRRAHPTPSGLFHLNWRSRGRHSSVNPQWYMEWYFNFESQRGLALHSYSLPGYPASHACVRLLERDAVWVYGWGEGWRRGPQGTVATKGTPLVIAGHYAFDSPPPWRSPEYLIRGITLPDVPMAHDGEHSIVQQTVGPDEPCVS